MKDQAKPVGTKEKQINKGQTIKPVPQPQKESPDSFQSKLQELKKKFNN
jgi:hypothetical protein